MGGWVGFFLFNMCYFRVCSYVSYLVLTYIFLFPCSHFCITYFFLFIFILSSLINLLTNLFLPILSYLLCSYLFVVPSLPLFVLLFSVVLTYFVLTYFYVLTFAVRT